MAGVSDRNNEMSCFYCGCMCCRQYSPTGWGRGGGSVNLYFLFLIKLLIDNRGCAFGGVNTLCILLTCQLGITVGDSGLCRVVCVTKENRWVRGNPRCQVILISCVFVEMEDTFWVALGRRWGHKISALVYRYVLCGWIGIYRRGGSTGCLHGYGELHRCFRVTWGAGGGGGGMGCLREDRESKGWGVAKRLRLIRHPLLCSFHAIFSLVISLLHWPNSRFW